MSFSVWKYGILLQLQPTPPPIKKFSIKSRRSDRGKESVSPVLFLSPSFPLHAKAERTRTDSVQRSAARLIANSPKNTQFIWGFFNKKFPSRKNGIGSPTITPAFSEPDSLAVRKKRLFYFPLPRPPSIFLCASSKAEAEAEIGIPPTPVSTKIRARKKKSFFLHFLFEGSRELFIRTLRGESAFFICRGVSFFPSMEKKIKTRIVICKKIWLATFILKMLLATKKGKRKTQSLKQSVWTSRFLRALLWHRKKNRFPTETKYYYLLRFALPRWLRGSVRTSKNWLLVGGPGSNPPRDRDEGSWDITLQWDRVKA